MLMVNSPKSNMAAARDKNTAKRTYGLCVPDSFGINGADRPSAIGCWRWSNLFLFHSFDYLDLSRSRSMVISCAFRYLISSCLVLGIGSFNSPVSSLFKCALRSSGCKHFASKPALRSIGSHSAMQMKFEFHEAQQSHEYNVGKVQRGYYSADPDGKVDKVIDRVMSEHLEDGSDEELKPNAESETLKYMPSLDVEDPIVAAMLKVCKIDGVTGFEMLDSRWNGNEGSQSIAEIRLLLAKALTLCRR
jgi:hypothetical protein